MTDELVFYTAAEVAEVLRLHPQVVQRKLQAGELPGYRIGREWRIERAQLFEWLERYSNQRVRPLTDRWFDGDGRLRALPTQRAKRRAVLDRVIETFETDRTYTEAEVNATLRLIFEDVAYLRREFIAEGLMTRDNGIYERTRPSAAFRPAAPTTSG